MSFVCPSTRPNCRQHFTIPSFKISVPFLYSSFVPIVTIIPTSLFRSELVSGLSPFPRSGLLYPLSCRSRFRDWFTKVDLPTHSGPSGRCYRRDRVETEIIHDTEKREDRKRTLSGTWNSSEECIGFHISWGRVVSRKREKEQA